MRSAPMAALAFAVILIAAAPGAPLHIVGSPAPEAVQPMAGSGTARDPYIITDVDQLQTMKDDLYASYALGNDIDAAETVNWNGGEGFVPVGGSGGYFMGRLDGRGHVISGLYVNRIDDANLGLFGITAMAVVQDVHLRDADVTGNSGTGTLIGRAAQYTVVKRCSATGTVSLKAGSGDAKSGGLIGAGSSGAQITQCSADVEVNAGDRRQVGGLVGYLRGVEPYSPVAAIRNSYSAGTVHGNGWKQGNLLGDADGSVVDLIYSSGFGKALVGFNFRDPTITRSYWDSDRGPNSSPYGGTPKPLAEMRQQTTFVGWNFASIWGIEEGLTYPYFRAAHTIEVEIDILPDQLCNIVTMPAKGIIAVAILSNADFDARKLAPGSLTFGPAAARIDPGGTYYKMDIDSDGDVDLVAHFRLRRTGIDCTTRTATLAGNTRRHDRVRGIDFVVVVPCGDDAAAAGSLSTAGTASGEVISVANDPDGGCGTR